MARLPQPLAQSLAAVRVLAVIIVLVGLAYPLGMTAVAHLPGLRSQAEGSLLHDQDGRVVGSRLIGQAFTDADGNELFRATGR